MIVKNEEAVLTRCLESAARWVDEIIIVDTGSTDKTIEIAEKFGAKISHFKWVNDFAAARNFSLEKAMGEWILWLDADDVLPEETGSRLRNLVSYAEPHVGCISMFYETRTNFKASHISRTSLFRNHPDIRFVHRVHEQLLIGSFTNIQTTLEVLHFPDEETVEGAWEKDVRYLAILEEEGAAHPNLFSPQFHLGMTYQAVKRFPEAIAVFERLLASTDPSVKNEGTRLLDTANRLLVLYRYTGDFEKGIKLTEHLLQRYPDHPLVLLNGGDLYLAAGYTQTAKKLFSQCVNTKYTELPDLCPPQAVGYWRFQRLAEAFLATGMLQDAQQLFEAVHEQMPDALTTIDGLARTYAALGEKDKAKKFRALHTKLIKGRERLENVLDFFTVCGIPPGLLPTSEGKNTQPAQAGEKTPS